MVDGTSISQGRPAQPDLRDSMQLTITPKSRWEFEVACERLQAKTLAVCEGVVRFLFVHHYCLNLEWFDGRVVQMTVPADDPRKEWKLLVDGSEVAVGQVHIHFFWWKSRGMIWQFQGRELEYETSWRRGVPQFLRVAGGPTVAEWNVQDDTASATILRVFPEELDCVVAAMLVRPFLARTMNEVWHSST